MWEFRLAIGPAPVTMACCFLEGGLGVRRERMERGATPQETPPPFPSLSLLLLSLPLSSYLDEEAQHGEHGQPPVLDLLDLQLGQGVRVVRQAQRVEGAARVELVARHLAVLDARAPALEAPELDGRHEQDLDGQGHWLVCVGNGEGERRGGK